MTVEEVILMDLLKQKASHPKREFMARVAALLLADASDSCDFKVQIALKDAIRDTYTLEDLAYAYIREFGDGETYEEVLQCLQNI